MLAITTLTSGSQAIDEINSNEIKILPEWTLPRFKTVIPLPLSSQEAEKAFTKINSVTKRKNSEKN